MGQFGNFSYVDGRWQDEPPSQEPYLTVALHDSDIVAVGFAPAEGAAGLFFLGVDPRFYFEDDGASPPIDRRTEAMAFAHWLSEICHRDVDPDALLALMAAEDPETEPLDTFVEKTLARLLAVAGLPLPEALSGWDEE